jgi:putative tricarboxylic transport membrane protein
MLDHILQALQLLLSPYVLMVMMLSAVYGLFIGAVPGLTATMAAALLIPFTFFMDPVPALAAIVTMEAMAIFAGDIPGALIRMPGTPSSAAYTDDSYELTKQGKAEQVLGVDVVFSVIGGLMGAVILMIAAPLLAEIALSFTSFEYFWLGILGLSASVMVSRGSQVKGAIALLFGLFLSTVGIDITLGYPRFTFGSVELLNGVNFIPAMIGLFGVSEVIRNTLQGQMAYPVVSDRAKGIFKGMLALLRRYKVNTLRSGLIGTFIGILPGAGADIAAWIAYAVSHKRSSGKDISNPSSMQGQPIIPAWQEPGSLLSSLEFPAIPSRPSSSAFFS